MVISIRDFISTGDFGPIKIGVTKDFVIETLGNPIKITEFENGLAEILYNGFRFFYVQENKRVYAILCQSFNDSFEILPRKKIFNLSQGIKVNTDFFIIGEKTKYKDLKNKLVRENFNYEEYSGKFWDKIICESGVEFIFNNWCEYPEDNKYDQEELELDGFRLFPIKNN